LARTGCRGRSLARSPSRSPRHGGGSSTTSSYGRVRIEMGPGLVDLTIRVDGYRPRAFRIDNPVAGYQEIELRFHPAR
jgi:hypothetical protein